MADRRALASCVSQPDRAQSAHGAGIYDFVGEGLKGCPALLPAARQGSDRAGARGEAHGGAGRGIEFHRDNRQAFVGQYAVAVEGLSDHRRRAARPKPRQRSRTDLDRKVTIRNEAHSVLQAINRRVTHISYHVGQIVFLAKHFAGREWKTLSIPPGGKSGDFNAAIASGKASQR